MKGYETSLRTANSCGLPAFVIAIVKYSLLTLMLCRITSSTHQPPRLFLRVSVDKKQCFFYEPTHLAMTCLLFVLVYKAG